MNFYLLRVLVCVILRLNESLYCHSIRAPLTISHEDNFGLFGTHAYGLQPWFNGMVHIKYITRGEVHDEVGVYFARGNAIAQVIGDDQTITHRRQHTFEREAVTRCFGVRANGIMAHEDEAFGPASARQDDLSAQGDGIPLGVDARVGTYDFNHFVLVVVFE